MAHPYNRPNDNTAYPPALGVVYHQLGANSSPSTPTLGGKPHAGLEVESLTRENTRTRTPSLTPSEILALNPDRRARLKEFFNPKNWKRYGWYWVGIVVAIATTVLITAFHEQIVKWLQPAAVWLRDESKVGWLVPIAILTVLSFPPLFGHEIVAALCGLVWGLWIGFGIVAAGTFLGELTNYFAFRYFCKGRSEKLERQKIFYACLSRVIRDGGFWIALVARYSAIPAHFTTAVFATCGMGIFVFAAAAFLSLPKQFANVYLGVLMGDSVQSGSHKSNRTATAVIITITVLVTIFAMRFLLIQINQIKPQVIYERRKARQNRFVLPE